MFEDVMAWSKGSKLNKIVSKETLNHAELLYVASGVNPYEDTQKAYMEAYKSLGIDLFGRVPEKNKTHSLPKGVVGEDEPSGYRKSYLGFYETFSRSRYPFQDVDEFLEQTFFNLDYRKLVTPVPHQFDAEEIRRKTALGRESGLYYYMFYTTLYMWGVEWLGPEIFLMAIALDAERVNEFFLREAFEQTKKAVLLLCETDNPFVFLHDDLSDARGPVCSHVWYENYIFPKYKELFRIVHDKGKKVIFTIDGNCEPLLQDLLDCGVDGIMPETPATDFDAILKKFEGKFIIGGMNGKVLCNGTPREVIYETEAVLSKTRGNKGFALSAPCGLHGTIPLENLEAYFDTRAKYGVNPENWRKIKR